MPKRGKNNENSTSHDKIQKTSTSDKRVNLNVTQPINIPIEIIIKIILNLTDIKDIRNCMQLSKEINSFIYRTPKIMNKLKVHFIRPDDSKIEEMLNFLTEKGHFVKNMSIKSENFKFKKLLIMTPNLVEFKSHDKPAERKFRPAGRKVYGFQRMQIRMSPTPTRKQEIRKFENYFWNKAQENDFEPVHHKSLKVLELNLHQFKHFLNITNKVDTLEKLSIFITFKHYPFYESETQRYMTEFILKQHNLKELNLINIKTKDFNQFPTRCISSDVKFKLKKLKFHTPETTIDNYFFEDFLKTQADSLEEIDFNLSLSDEILDIIFNYFKKLKKITQKTYKDSMMIRTEDVVDRTLDTVTYYRDRSNNDINLRRVIQTFPNLDSIDCVRLNEFDGNYDMLNELLIYELDISDLKIMSFNNLTNLTANQILEFKSDENWTKFAKSIKNVSNLTIMAVKNADDILTILKSLHSFKQLKTFKFRNNPGTQKKFKMDNNETFPNGNKFYKILIDVDRKTVKVSSYIVRRCKDMLRILIHYFGDFEFFEYCFHFIAIEKLDIEDEKISAEEFFDNMKNCLGNEDNLRSQTRSLRRLPVKSYKK